MDGIYRVQTTRIESVEVSKQIMATQASEQLHNENVTFKLTDIKTTDTGALSMTVVQEVDDVVADDEKSGKTKKMTATKIRSNFKRTIMTRWQKLDECSNSQSADNDEDEHKFSFEGRFKTEENASETDCPTVDDTDTVDASSDDNRYPTDDCAPVKCIDDFSVMRKYLKKKRPKNKIIITVDEVDERGNILHTETRDATEFHL